MKHRGHVYMAHLIHEELYRNKGELEIKTIPDQEGKRETLRYRVPDVLANAILQHRGCFIAGSIGPDFFPDMITGQMYIHPQNSGRFLDLMFEELRKLHPNLEEFEKALAFYAGWLMHYCGDMYGHQYVNRYSYGWFPSIADLMYDAADLFKLISGSNDSEESDTDKAISFFADKFQVEQITRAVDNPDQTTFLEVLNDPQNQEEFCQTMGVEKDDPDFWDKVTEIIAPVVKLFRVVNGVTTIIRHLAIESYMDKTIQARLDDQDAELFEKGSVAEELNKFLYANSLDEAVNQDEYRRSIYYHLDLPKEYIRRCFTTPETFWKLRGDEYTQISVEVTEGMRLSLDFLGKYMEYYEVAYRNLLKEQGSTNAMGDLNVRTRYLDKWVELWYKMVQWDLVYDTPIPDGQKENMLYEIGELFMSNIYADKDSVLEIEESTESLYKSRLLGFLQGLGTMLEGVGLGLEVLLKGLFYFQIEDFKKITTPYLELVANSLIELGVSFETDTVEGYENSLEVIEAAFRNPELLIKCKPLFGDDDLLQVFDEEWKNLGTGKSYSGQTNCFNLGFEMLENALQMGKLCLIGNNNLNDLLKTNGTDVSLFQEYDARWTLGSLVMDIRGKENGRRFQARGFKLVLDIYTKGKAEPTMSWTVADLTGQSVSDQNIVTDLKGLENLRCDIPFHPEPVLASELNQCVLRVVRPSGNYPSDLMACTVSIYDRDTKVRLFSVDTSLRNQNGFSVDILPLDKEQVQETIEDKLRNALICENFNELNVTIKVSDIDGAGTDEAVYFRICDTNGNPIGVKEKGHDKCKSEVSLDKGSGTNDFERNSTATYALELERTVNVRDVKCFSIRRESDGNKCSAKLYIDWFEVWVNDNGTIVTLAKNEYRSAQHIGKSWVDSAVDLDSLRAEELEIEETEVRELLVDIKTANRLYAGTDDNVLLQVISGLDTIRAVELDSDRNDFEKGHTDSFTVDITKNGKGVMSTEITGFAIVKTNNFTAGGDWEIEEVLIRDSNTRRLLGCFKAYSGYDHNTVMLTDNTPTLSIS